MAVKIRLSRVGKKKVPFYRIVAVDSRKKRDGAYLDNLGTYDGLKGILIEFHLDKINDWISKGAIPTDSVKKLMKMNKDAAELKVKKTAVASKKAKKDEPTVEKDVEKA